MSKTILLAGGTGQIGKLLTDKLLELNYKIHILSRSIHENTTNVSFFKWNPTNGEFPIDSLKDVSVVINLTGRAVDDKRWSDNFKQELYKSRIESTKLLVKYVNLHKPSIETFVNTSAIGYYGMDRKEEVLNEDADPGSDFFGKLCFDWEKAVQLDSELTIRKVIIRIGVVLMPNSGAFHKLKQPVLLSVGSAIGTGQQYVSWIHQDDLIGIFLSAIHNKKMVGTINAVAPNPVRNKFLIGRIADSLNKVILLPNVPSFALQLILGEMSKVVLGSLKVVPERLQELNYHFRYERIEDAIRNLIWKK